MRQAGDYFKLLVNNVAECKLKFYVGSDVVDAVRAATGDAAPWPAGAGHSTAELASSDAEEVLEDETVLTSAVASSRPKPPAL